MSSFLCSRRTRAWRSRAGMWASMLAGLSGHGAVLGGSPGHAEGADPPAAAAPASVPAPQPGIPAVAASAAPAASAVPLPTAAAGEGAAFAASPTVQTQTRAADLKPMDLAAAVELGRMLFFDPLLSSDRWVSCGSCHQPGLVFSDGLRTATGVDGRKGVRNAPSLLDVGQQRSLFWDGRRASLEEQALDPFVHPDEQNLGTAAEVLARLRADPRYAPALEAAYGVSMEALSTTHVAAALATFQRTLVSGTSPFDRYLKGDVDALPAAARRGWGVFHRTARCTRCHSVRSGADGRPLFTDHRFHARAATVQGTHAALPRLTQRLQAVHRAGLQHDPTTLSDPEFTQLGRYVFTLQPGDVAAFKTPALRNVALTAPYMHDGSAATLEDAVDLEVRDRPGPAGTRLRLTPLQRSDLVEFLRALTGESPAEVLEGTSPDALGTGSPPIP